MDVHACLPDPEALTLLGTTIGKTVVWLDVESRARSTPCPRCGTPSTRKHSRYVRTLKDVPLLSRRVRWRLTVYKYFCDVQGCPQQVFCERLPSVLAPWRRATLRLEAQQRLVALEAGAESATRILTAQGSPVSATTLLTWLRQEPPSTAPPVVRRLGIDDWAWRTGQRYGTILVDLDRHQVIDLLADREPDTLVAWLEQHPEVELVTRDRSTAYQEAVTRGAPQARQVADRWHLLKNIRETLERYVLRVHDTIKAVAKTLPMTPVPVVPDPVLTDRPPPEAEAASSGMCPPTARQVARFEAVKHQLQQGLSVKKMAREVGVAKGTVEKYKRLTQHPGPARPWSRPRELDAFLDWLRAKWSAGTQNASTLYQALRAQGYVGGYTVVREFCRQLRMGMPIRPRRWVCPSPKTLSWALLNRKAIRSPQVATLLDHCDAQHPELARVGQLLTDGWNIFNQTSIVPLKTWLTALTTSDVKELQAFAVGIDRDYDAIREAVETSFSNGQVEGQVNRLKTLKRGMYGRAGLDLLRARVRYRSGSP